jgi:D-3-phosphoglycerate dehydrogenase
MKILINDGIADAAIKLLEEAGFEVDTNKIPQEELMTRLQDYVAICVRSATKVRKELIEACPGLKAIGRGGVGLDNIDVDYARSKGIYVLNTPAASSRSVAELAFAHMLSIARSVHDSNRKMPVSGSSEFKNLKKAYSKGIELEGKTLGVIGLGRIGQETVRIGLGMGMNIVGVDPYVNTVNVRLGGRMYGMDVEIKSQDMDTLLADADFISIHVPSLDKPIISSAEISKMKDGAVIVNCSRGGIIDEDALLAALDSGKLMGAGLDVFVGEPSPREDVLQHPGLTLTPHTGASTLEAQDKIGIELAEKLISVLK